MKMDILSVSRELLDEKYTVRLKTKGYSMYPVLRPDDTVYIDHVPFEELKPSSIVVFKRKEQWVAHRLIHLKIHDGQTVLKTQGDSCIRLDEDVSRATYIGKVAFRKRKNKVKCLLQQSQYGQSLLRTRPIVHFMLHLIVKIVRRRISVITFLQNRFLT